MFWNKKPLTPPISETEAILLARAFDALKEADTDLDKQKIIDSLLEEDPTSVTLHLCASALFAQQGRMTECIAEHALALALDPTNPVPFRRLGLLMRRAGREVLAEAILENGWSLMKQLFPKQRHAQEKQRFFSQEEQGDLGL